MPIFDIFSKRQMRARGEIPDVYQYENFPKGFRIQVVHILLDALGDAGSYNEGTTQTCKFIHDTLCREYGVFNLGKHVLPDSIGHQDALINFLLNTDTPDRVLDVIELSFQVIDNVCRTNKFRYQSDTRIEPDEAISELNSRFLEHGIGYQFEAGEIIRMDSKIAHETIVKPTLVVLAEKRFKGANQEFLSAHRHYRNSRYKECLVDCLKSFESVLKVICSSQNWPYKESDTASKLIDICFSNGLIPSYLQSHFSAVRSTLESGIPTVRNKSGGHGQGTDLITVPDYLARYLLNLTATSILLLSNAETEI